MVIQLRLRLNVFPTPVGMNRECSPMMEALNGVPHARGDEPIHAAIERLGGWVFPTPVGMNRSAS